MAKRQKGISNPKLGMVRSRSTYLLEDNLYTFMNNGQSIDESGNQFTLSNEHSNILAVKFANGYKVVGLKNSIVKNRTYFFLHNPSTGLSEIGYVSNTKDIVETEDTQVENPCDSCTPYAEVGAPLENIRQQPHQQYVKLLGDCSENKCLNFSLDRPILGIELKIENVGEVMAFAHKGNPPRYIELDNLTQYQYIGMEVCGNEAQPTCLDCEKMKIFSNSEVPIVKNYERVLGGSLRKGAYEVVMAYCDDMGNEKTSYYPLITPPIYIFDEGNVIHGQDENREETNYSIKITVENLDLRFTNYKVVIIENSSQTSRVGTLLYYVGGIYPTTHRDIILSKSSGEPISPNIVQIPLTSIDHWEGLTSANGYLIGTGVKETEEVNLQPVFNLMGGLIKWQSSVVKGDLHKSATSGRYKGYNRDEVYPIAIKPLSNDGYEYPKFPLIARPPKPGDIEDVDWEDINVASINTNVGECDGILRTKVWQNFNTSKYEGRCDSFNSSTVTLYGFSGLGDIIINGNPYTVTWSESLEETAQSFVAEHREEIESLEGLGVISTNGRIVISPSPDALEYLNISGNLGAEIDNRGVPTMPQNENIEVITEVLPRMPRVIATLYGETGTGQFNINGTIYNIIGYQSLEETAKIFAESQTSQDILNNEGITVRAANNTIEFHGIESGISYANTTGGLEARVSDPGIPPIPGTTGPIDILPQYIDNYTNLEEYVNELIYTCNVDPTMYYRSPLEQICEYINLDNLSEYQTEPTPEDGCRDPQSHFISENLRVYGIIGENATYTPKLIGEYADVSPPSNCNVFVSSAGDEGKGEDGKNSGIDKGFSGAYFLRWNSSSDKVRESEQYNPTVLQKQYVTYAETPDNAVKLQNITPKNKGEIEAVSFVHPYHGEMVVGDRVTPAYIELLPEEGGTGNAKIVIEEQEYTIEFVENIERTASVFVTQKASTIRTRHSLELTSEENILIFDGDITRQNTPRIIPQNGNLRGVVGVGDNLLRAEGGYGALMEIDENNASRILTNRYAAEQAILEGEKIGDVHTITQPYFGGVIIRRNASRYKFLSKIHKGGIWTKIESRNRDKFYIEITKMLEPLAPSIKRDYEAGDRSTSYFRNKYVRYTLFENPTTIEPLEEYREDLSNTEIELTGTSGRAKVVINGQDYNFEMQNTLEETALSFVSTHRENIYNIQGKKVRVKRGKLVFSGERQGYSPVTIQNITGNLNGVAIQENGGYYPMGGIIELTENHRIEIEMERLLTSSMFDGDLYMVVDLPITSAIGLGEDRVPGDADAPLYHTIVTIPLGSCFSVVTRDKEFSEIKVDYSEIQLKKDQNWLTRCTFDVPIINSCKPIPHKYGEFAYWESTEIYPDNPELYDSTKLKIHVTDIPAKYARDFSEYVEEATSEGDYILSEEANFICKPIRHFKFPDNKVSPFMYERKTNRDAEVIIYPLGLRIDDELFESFMDIAVNNGLISKERRNKIVGYEVFRGDRSINKSILGSGMLFDMRSYKNDIGDDIHYPNYPYNSLGKDKFNLGVNGQEIQLNPNKNHIFTFHGPEQDYYKGITGFSELTLQGYLFGTSRNTIAEVEDHPKYTILGKKAKSLATTLATIEVLAEAVANIASTGENYRISFGFTNSLNPVGIVFSIANIISSTINLVTTKVGRYRYEWLKTFRDMGSPTNFAHYTTSVARYNYFRTLQSQENLFRGVATSRTIDSGTYSITENVTGKPIVINNLDRETSLMISFTEEFPFDLSKSSSYLEYKTYDNNNTPGRSSQVLSSEIGCQKGESPEVYRNTASPYAALKSFIPNQYGSIGNIVWVSTGAISDLTRQDCGLVLGGDTFITPHTVKRKLPFFKATAFGQADLTPFAYSVLGNIGKPRFYIDYEINTERSTQEQPFPEIESVTNADCKDEKFYLERPSKFYLYAYGQPEFFVESTINTYYRNAQKEPWNQFYPQNQDYVRLTQEKEVSIRRPNSYFYNFTYSYQGTPLSSKVLPDNYNREVFSKRSHNINSAMYSIQDINENSTSEPWLSYRAADHHVFPASKGKLIHLKGIENKQILAVFENTTEIYNAVDTFIRGINSSNTEIGTGGIFASGAVRSFSETDLGYIGSQSRSLLSNEFGHFLVDSQRGQIFKINPGAKEGGAQEISRYSQDKPNGMDVWFKEHLPFKILRSFPEYKEYTDNPYNGVGILIGWDAKFRRVLITKKDYVPLNADICQNNGKFYDSSTETIDAIISAEKGSEFVGQEGCKLKFTRDVEGTVEDCLESLRFVVAYRANNMGEMDKPPCFGSHNCNRAVFDITGNGILIGQISMNNSGGPRDLKNRFPNYNPNGQGYPGQTEYDRYSEVTLSSSAASAIANTSTDGSIDISFECACIAGENCDQSNCHQDISWIRIYKDGEEIYNGCPQGNFIRGFQPCEELPVVSQEEYYVDLPEISLEDTKHFRDVSWTITYKPEQGYWESYMDFKPNYYINHTDYFQTGVNNSKDPSEIGLWSHLLTNKSKQVFYGKRYPWTVEFPTKNEYAPKRLQGLEIWTEAKRYHNEYDYAIDGSITFNKLNIFSDSQSSGNLELVPNTGALSMLSKYPITHQDRQEILITRSNGRWTLNDIYNRAKSNRNNVPLFKYDHNQINKEVNPDAVSFYGKTVLEQLTSENFLVRLTQDKTSQYDMELKFVIQTEEIL